MGNFEVRSGDGLHLLTGLKRSEKRLEFLDILGEAVGAGEIAAERAQRELIGAGRESQTQIDSAGVKRLQRSELFGNHQRRVIGQHNAPEPTRIVFVPPAT